MEFDNEDALRQALAEAKDEITQYQAYGFGGYNCQTADQWVVNRYNEIVAEQNGQPTLSSLTQDAVAAINNLLSQDPNALIGPAGVGTPSFIRDSGNLGYTVDFANDGSAAAQVVTVTQQLDSNLDWSTFQLGSFGFGPINVTVPAGLAMYETTVNYQNSDGSSLNVLVSLNFSVATGQLTVTFTSLDPLTGQAPTGVFDGFLPPDDASGIGEGYVQYTVQPKTGLATGVTIGGQAAVVFDINAPLDTAQVSNAIDSGAPTSSVTALPATEASTSFTVSWSGQDDAGGSGIAGYNIWVSDNGGSYSEWQTNTPNTSATYTGVTGHTYTFFSQAIDNVGNLEPTHASADTQTTISNGQTSPPLSVTDNGGTYTGSAFPGPSASVEGVTPTLKYYSGTIATGTSLGGAPSTAGTYTVLASFAGSTDYTSGTASTTFTITPAAPTLSVTEGGGTYNDAVFAASDTVAGVVSGVDTTPAASLEEVTPSLTYYSGTSATGTALGGAPSTVGTYTVLASFAGSTDYSTASASATFSITKATPTVRVTDGGGVYTGSAFGATDTVDNGTSLENVTPSLTYYSGTSATGTALGGAPSTVGTYTVLASFAGSTDYSTGSASATFSITKATPTVHVTDGGGVYTGSAFGATDTVDNGTSLENVTPSLTYYSGTSATGTALGGAPSTVGTYTVLANFAGSTDYSTASASATFSITKATPTLTVMDGGGVYTGSAFGATDTVDNSTSLENVTPSLTYYSGTSATGTALGGAPSTVGTYTVLASFAGSTDYSTGSASATFSITKATPTVRVTDASGTYTDSAFGATDTVNGGASLENVTPTLAYYTGTAASGSALSSAPTTVGTYTILASFAGSTDYSTGSASATFSITKAAPTLTVTDNGGVSNGSPYPASDTVAGVGGQSTAAASLEGVTPTLSYYSGTVATGTALAGAPSAAGTYVALAKFAGSTDYNSASASTTFTISGGKTAPTVTVTDAGGVYTGSAFPATDKVNGGASLENVTPSLKYYSGTTTSGSSLSSSPSTAGTYTVLASFAGSTDCTSATASATFTITKAAPTVNVTDSGGTYKGAAFAATDTVAGVGSQSTPAASLESVTPKLSYYSGTGATGTSLSGAPTHAGTYTVVASFAGSTDYGAAQSHPLTFTIGRAPLTITADNKSKVVGSVNPPLTFTASGFVPGDTSANLTTQPVLSTTATVSSPVGSYPINVSGATSPDYTISFVAGTLTVTAQSMPSILVLDPKASGALILGGNALVVEHGAVVVDSNSTTALQASGNAQLTATAIDVVGRVQESGNAALHPAPVTGSTAVADPLAALAAPAAGVSLGAVNLAGNSSLTINPGLYSQINVSGNAHLTLNPGNYEIAGGGFSVSGNGKVSGSGVLIYNAGSLFPRATGGSYGSVNFSGNSSINLTGPTTGLYSGIDIFQSRDNTTALQLSGSALVATGTVYASAALLNIAGNSIVSGTLIVDKLSLAGNAQIVTTSLPLAVASTAIGSDASANGASSTSQQSTQSTANTTNSVTAVSAPWQNSVNPLDVLGTGGPIVPSDALAVIDYLNTHAADAALPSTFTPGSGYLDVLGIGTVVPNDALAIINYLNLNPAVAGVSTVVGDASASSDGGSITLSSTVVGGGDSSSLQTALAVGSADASLTSATASSSSPVVSPAVVAAGQASGSANNSAAAQSSSAVPVDAASTGLAPSSVKPAATSAVQTAASRSTAGAVDSLLADSSLDWLDD